jgi:hypothetical protein
MPTSGLLISEVAFLSMALGAMRHTIALTLALADIGRSRLRASWVRPNQPKASFVLSDKDHM